MFDWYARRVAALVVAKVTEGYGTFQLPGERNIGRIIMQRRYGPWKGGFYPKTHPEFQAMTRHYAAKHKKATMELPK